MSNRGKFITLEGPDGSGKSSVVEFLGLNIDRCITTKEPGSPLDSGCMEIRRFILNPDNKIDNEAELFLYMADRCQHVNKIIRPNLDKGKHVICDRYIDSTYAYQGWGRRRGDKESLEYIEKLNNYSTGGLIPDLTIILTVDSKIGLSRATKTEFGKPDRFESEKIDFHERVRNGYDHLLANKKDRNIAMLDTTYISEERIKEVVLLMVNLELSNTKENAQNTLDCIVEEIRRGK